MNKSILFVIFLFVAFSYNLIAQTKVTFSYDNSGNRTNRTIYLSSPIVKSSIKDTLQINDQNTNSMPETKEQIFNEVEGDRKIVIYPNPTKGQLKIEISGYDLDLKSAIYIYNASGAVIKQKYPVNAMNMLDLSNYTSGIYILKIVIGDKESEWKIVKE